MVNHYAIRSMQCSLPTAHVQMSVVALCLTKKDATDIIATSVCRSTQVCCGESAAAAGDDDSDFDSPRSFAEEEEDTAASKAKKEQRKGDEEGGE